MALMYPWATKEYLLWEMSLGQIVMYHNLGIELKHGGGTRGGKKTLRGANASEIRMAREEARRQLGMADAMRRKYGAD